jgi:hypothetical protein
LFLDSDLLLPLSQRGSRLYPDLSLFDKPFGHLNSHSNFALLIRFKGLAGVQVPIVAELNANSTHKEPPKVTSSLSKILQLITSTSTNKTSSLRKRPHSRVLLTIAETSIYLCVDRIHFSEPDDACMSFTSSADLHATPQLTRSPTSLSSSLDYPPRASQRAQSSFTTTSPSESSTQSTVYTSSLTSPSPYLAPSTTSLPINSPHIPALRMPLRRMLALPYTAR